MSELLKKLAEDLYNGDADSVVALVRQALNNGLTPAEILEHGLIAGMNVVGKDFRDGLLFIPEVLIAARAMHAGMGVLKPLLAESDVPPTGRFLIGTVQGDLHDIGKNLVAMMMEGAGFEVHDLGVDVPAQKFVAEVKAWQPDVLGLSALLTTTMAEMKTVIEALDDADLRDRVKVLVGGAPVTEKYAAEIGADGYAANASTAVEEARKLLLLGGQCNTTGL
ncbi:MAG: corrinoid protein [Anaerolineae bacterium]|jgi:5-methyltetrahydrofolate--homocysteine methyltransferase|nr:corrinoid protein [Anaerolineae bacterium]MDH7474929.1 corrinoid protein [Anaerolineae bacterium]